MKFKKSVVFIIPLICLITLLTNSFLLDYINIPNDALLSGLLALIGFIFGVRTFLIFKLQELVYSNKDYQKWHKKLCIDLDFKQELYDPLKKFDFELNHSILISVISLFFISINSIFNINLKVNVLYSAFFLSFLSYNMAIIIFVLYKTDRNMKYIINFWSENYKRQNQ